MDNLCLSTNWILEDFLYLFFAVDSDFLCVSFFGHSVNFNRFGNFYNNFFFVIKKLVLAFKNMTPLLHFCRLFICYVDTDVESHVITINSVAIFSRSKFNLTGLQITQKFGCRIILRSKDDPRTEISKNNYNERRPII